MRRIGGFQVEHELREGRHLDEAVGVAVVPERDAPTLAVAMAEIFSHVVGGPAWKAFWCALKRT